MIKLKNILFEDVYGVKSIVYHRTNKDENFNNILTKGFDPGSGDMYGKGLYTTYMPTSKTSDNSKYGPIQIKFMVEVVDFFIFDYDIYEKNNTHIRRVEERTGKKSTKKNFIQLQARYFDIKPKRGINYYSKFSSNNALAMGFNRNHNYYHKVNGIIFTGEHDGKVLVCYNTKLVVPLSYTDDKTGKTTYLKDIKNSTAFYQRYVTGSMSRYDSLQKTPWTQTLTPEHYETKYNLKYNKDTQLYDSMDSIFIKGSLMDSTGKLIIKFNKAMGDVYITNDINSLEGVPIEVNGSFDCAAGFRKSLKYSPKKVTNNFDCSNNYLTSLKGGPEEVGGDYRCSDNPLKTLNGSPKKVGGNFDCMRTKIRSLVGGPEEVGGNMFVSINPLLESLKGAPRIVHGNFYCAHTNIESFKGSPDFVGKNLLCSNKKIKSLKGITQNIGGVLGFYLCTNLESLDYLPKATAYEFPYHFSHNYIMEVLKKYGNYYKDSTNPRMYILKESEGN
jgi:hypothetical protein